MNANVATPSDANLRIRIRGKKYELAFLDSCSRWQLSPLLGRKKKLKMDFSSLSFHNVCLNRMRRYILMEIS